MPTAVASILVLLFTYVLPCKAQTPTASGRPLDQVQVPAEAQEPLEAAFSDPKDPWEQSDSKATEATTDLLPTCSCECCRVAERRPDELKGPEHTGHDQQYTDLKCLANQDNDLGHTCPSQCQIGIESADVVQNELSGVQSTEYYCMVECKPATTEIGSKCMAMGAHEIEKAKSDDGTAEDIWPIPESLMPPTEPPKPEPLVDPPKQDDEPLVIKAPEAEKSAPAAASKKKEAGNSDDAAAKAKAEALATNEKVQAVIKTAEKGVKAQATESEKHALEVRKIMEKPLSPNGFLLLTNATAKVNISLH